jgi:hypothetical protein
MINFKQSVQEHLTLLRGSVRDGDKAHRPVSLHILAQPKPLPGRPATITGQIRSGQKTNQVRHMTSFWPAGYPMVYYRPLDIIRLIIVHSDIGYKYFLQT